MSWFVDFLKVLLDTDLRVKNAVSILIGLILVVVGFFTARRTEWFEEIRKQGATVVLAALLILFLIGYLLSFLVCTYVQSRRRRTTSHQMEVQEAEQEIRFIRDNLESLTPWQGDFLMRLIVADRRQIADYEIGEYRAVWGPEIEVLVAKRILKQHVLAGVYEIEPVYYHYLKQNLNPRTGELA